MASRATAAEAEIASRVLARRRLLPFVQRHNPRYQAGWVHQDVCRRLEKFSEDVAAQRSPRLMLLMPPRSGKSELASRIFPPWHLGRHPDHEFIACSYNVSLALTFSRKIKDLMQDPAYQSVFDARLSQSNQSAEEWVLAPPHSGGYVAAGVGGGITGKGAHILAIDDPIKNAADADSGDLRDSLWEWYTSTAYTRLAPGGGVLLTQTWWHDDDLAGRLQESMQRDPLADQFVVVKYPAIAEEDEYLDHATGDIVRGHPPEPPYTLLRRQGEALHPERYDIDKLEQIRRTLTTRWWSSLYQQNPVPAEGEFFVKDQFLRLPTPHRSHCNVFQAWDFAISEKRQNDYTVGSCGYQDPDNMLHAADLTRFKSGSAHAIADAMVKMALRHRHPSLTIGVEDGQIWRAIRSTVLEAMRKADYFPPIVPLTPLTDKQARATTLQGRMQHGQMSFAPDAGWFPTVQTEMLRFPAGTNDDCVDSLAWLAILAAKRQPPKPPPPPKPLRSWKDRLNARTGATHMAA